MSWGELLTRLTIWIALSGYALGVIGILVSGKNRAWQSLARWAWTVGCLGLLAHTVCAFHFYHAWSQASAYRETARQTAEVMGYNWGGGLFINYSFIAAWMMDVIWWWRGLDVYRQRPRFLVMAWQGFFVFMVFNATVVFKTGPLRWIGLGLCLGLGLLWWLTSGSRDSGRVKASSSNQNKGQSKGMTA